MNNERPELEINLAGPQGNIFAVTGMASRLLGKEDAAAMQKAVTSSHSYEEALDVVNTYVWIIDLSGMYDFE